MHDEYSSAAELRSLWAEKHLAFSLFKWEPGSVAGIWKNPLIIMLNSFHSLDQLYKVIKSFNDSVSGWDCGLVVTDFGGKAELPKLAQYQLSSEGKN